MIESLALAISKINGAFTPGSEAFTLNNPGLLASFSERNGPVGSIRKFTSWEAGFHALKNDLQVKCSGKSKSGIKATSPLRELCFLFKIKEPRIVTNFLSQSTGSEVSESTPISTLMESVN